MSYIRAKVINGRSYLYLVESRREGDRVIQKHLKYLGRGTKADIQDKYQELGITPSREVKYEQDHNLSDPELQGKVGTTKIDKKEPKEEKEISYLDKRSPEVKSEYANINDLDFKTLERAHNNTSFDPDLRARQEQNDYVRVIDDFSKRLMKFAETPEQKEQAQKEIDRFKEGYKSKVLALMGAKSRTLSPMITGPARFPTRRNEKALNVEHKRLTELLEYKERAENKAFGNVKGAHPGGVSHYETQRLKDTVDSDIATIKAIDEKKEGFTYYSRSTWSGSLAGKIRRKINNGDYETAVATYDHIQEAEKKAGIKPVFKSNNRIHKEIASIRGKKAPAKATGTSTIKTYKSAKVINNRDAERVQILFDGMPSPEIRKDLKSRGFRWSRNEGAWQRKNTRNAEYDSKDILDKHLEPVEDNET